MTDYNTPFERVLSDPIRPKFSRKYRAVLLHPPGVSRYYGVPGDLIDYDDSYSGQMADGTYMYAVIPETFDAVLLPERFHGGRSAANVRFRDENRGYTYLMSADEAVKAIAATSLPGGKVRGTFEMNKKGSNFRLNMLTQYDKI